MALEAEQSSPDRRDWAAVHIFREPRTRRSRCSLGQIVERKELRLRNLMIRLFRRGLFELQNLEQHDMITAPPPIEKNPDQSRRADNPDICLFHDLAHQRLADALARVDGASRQIPAGHISVAHEKYAAFAVADDGADTERHRPPNAVNPSA